MRRAAISLIAAVLVACGGGGTFDTPTPQGGATAAGQLPPIIPITHFFDNPEIAGAQVSPDGRWLSYLKPYQGKLNIHLRPIAGGEERVMTTDTVRPVSAYFWAANSDQLLYVQDKGGDENYHVYSVPIAGTGVPQARNLTPFPGTRAIIFAGPDELPDRILVGLNRRDPSVFDAYWLNLYSGELTMVAENPGRHAGYALDPQNRVRLAQGTDERGNTLIHVRDTETSPWRVIATYPAEENVGVLRFHPDGQRLWMVSNHGDRDLAALVLLDIATGQEQVVESDPQNEVDLSGASFSDRTDSLLATVYAADTVRIYPKTEAFARDLARLRQIHRGTPSVSSMTTDERTWVVSFNSPTDPGATYVYNRDTGEARFLFRPRPWLVPEQLADMQPVEFQARDGMTVHGYLTTPRGVQPGNLPLVLLVHGGPWARDYWGYQPEVQFLANRGYAVLQINYRGSTGYGKRFYNAAVKQFGRAMHDDLIDGVRWAVQQGIADPQRVGIYGGSYGGYATLVGMTFTPEVFACGVDYVGPSSLITLIESFPAYWRPFLEGTWFRFVGDPADPATAEDLRARSPLFFVDRIQDPLLIVQGANDPRVTKREADQLAIALRDRGVPVRYIIAENEGHGFQNPNNRLALYRSMETFFASCLNGRTQPTVDASITQRIAEMTVNVDTLKLATAGAAADVQPLSFAGATLRTGSAEYAQTIETQGRRIDASSTVTVSEATLSGKPVWVVVEAAQSPMGAATDTVWLDRATLLPVKRSVHQGPVTVSLDFAADAVKGSIQAGPQQMPVDAKLTGPVAIPGAPLNAALAAASLQPGTTATIDVFDVLASKVSMYQVRVGPAESVTVPAGTFQAVKVELVPEGGQNVTVWIEQAAPRRVVKSVTQLPPAAGGGTVTAELR